MASTPNSTSGSPQAKINQKLAVRTLGALFGLVVLFGGFRLWQHLSEDLGGIGEADTRGMIAAVEFLENGQQAVLVDQDGNVVRNPGHKPGVIDRDLAWQPDGNRLFFVSDREGNGFQMFRWNPSKDGGKVEIKSTGSRGKSSPYFAPGGNQALLMSGGFVLEYDPRKASMQQVLPPTAQEITTDASVGEGGEDGGASGVFTATYGRLGRSFRAAKWLDADRSAIAAVMLREEGEVLLIQQLPGQGGKLTQPVVIASGDRIEFDVHPATGTVVFAVLSNDLPNASQIPPTPDPVPIVRGAHYIARWSLQGPKFEVVTRSPDEKQIAFSQIALSPDGERMLVTFGSFDGTSVNVQRLVSVPAKPDPSAQPKIIADGAVQEPSWAPAGDRVTFVKREGGKRAIYIANADGSGLRSLTGSNGDFGTPKFSPQG